MFNTRVAVAAAAVALALVGATASTGQAAASGHRQLSQNVRFYNAAVDGNLDGNANGTYPITYPSNGSPVQTWTLTPTGQGSFLIANVYKTLCLQAPAKAGDPIALLRCNSTNPAQWWNLDESDNKVVITEYLDGDYAIQSNGNYTTVLKAFSDHNELQEWDVLPA
ncbi:ricin-type beta-trefoil lectin domain protein [Kitasatospora sp. NPDC056076]|uniref:ricin-type beta-trefoil lectin domain protein n=1 Tax=Kitasatospora sp. NPDC056076 TaxID=3345703 RepID=UPI0035E0405C